MSHVIEHRSSVAARDDGPATEWAAWKIVDVMPMGAVDAVAVEVNERHGHVPERPFRDCASSGSAAHEMRMQAMPVSDHSVSLRCLEPMTDAAYLNLYLLSPDSTDITHLFSCHL